MQGMTLTQHIRGAQLHHPGAKGELSSLLTQIGVAGKIISSKVNMAGLVDVLGSTGVINVQGEVVQKLDEVAEETVQDIVGRSGHVCALLSEERKAVLEVPEKYRGEYVVTYDPLDGSSNIDANVSIGTIFGIFHKKSADPYVTRADWMRPGREMVAAGYILYGSSTVFVYTAGDGVHCFTLDPGVGEYILSMENLRLDDRCKCLSINHCNGPYWDPWVHDFIGKVMARNDADKRRISGRHIGSLVADFHRNLMYGGIYLYPVDALQPRGKLRLFYEANPLAMIVEEAGGAATDGRTRILDLMPDELHHRTALVLGNKPEVELARQCMLAGDKKKNE